MDGYRNCERLLSGSHTTDMLRSQIALFCTWASIQRYDDLEMAAAHIAEHKEWLIGWGFPERAAEIHIEAIRRRLGVGNG